MYAADSPNKGKDVVYYENADKANSAPSATSID